MEYINIGTYNDGTGDKINVAAIKINNNFKKVFDKLKIKKPFKKIIWNNLSESRKAAEDINYNFKIIDDFLNL